MKRRHACSAAQSCLTLWPHGLRPTRLLCPWDSPGKKTGVGCHFLLQGIFLTQGSNLDLLHCRKVLSRVGSWDRERERHVKYVRPVGCVRHGGSGAPNPLNEGLHFNKITKWLTYRLKHEQPGPKQFQLATLPVSFDPMFVLLGPVKPTFSSVSLKSVR